MPLYKLVCLTCGVKKSIICNYKDKPTVCACGGKLDMDWSDGKPPAGHVFQPFLHPHMDFEPVEIRSKSHLRDECDKRGVTSDMLD